MFSFFYSGLNKNLLFLLNFYKILEEPENPIQRVGEINIFLYVFIYYCIRIV